MDGLFETMDGLFETMDGLFETMDGLFETMDGLFETMIGADLESFWLFQAQSGCGKAMPRAWAGV